MGIQRTGMTQSMEFSEHLIKLLLLNLLWVIMLDIQEVILMLITDLENGVMSTIQINVFRNYIQRIKNVNLWLSLMKQMASLFKLQILLV